jgi:hypothetical protein
MCTSLRRRLHSFVVLTGGGEGGFAHRGSASIKRASSPQPHTLICPLTVQALGLSGALAHGVLKLFITNEARVSYAVVAKRVDLAPYVYQLQIQQRLYLIGSQFGLAGVHIWRRNMITITM